MSARRIGFDSLAAALVLALLVRLGWYELLPYYDEIRPLKQGSFLQLLAEGETGVNPPLYRWWMTRPANAVTGLWLGRITATLGSVLGVALSSLLAWRLAGSWIATVGTALVLAVLPDAVRNGVEARVYGVAAPAVVALVLCAGALPSLRARIGVAALCALIPWLHYSAVPWLGLVALSALVSSPTRSALALFVPAGILVTPLARAVIAGSNEQVPPREGVLDVVRHVLTLGLDAVPGKPAWTLPVLLLPLIPVGAALVRGGITWRHDAPSMRLAWIAALAWPVSAGVVGAVQMVRTPVFGLAAHVLVPFTLATLARMRPGRLLAALTTALCFALAWPAQSSTLAYLQGARAPEAAAGARVRLATATEPVVGVYPPSWMEVVGFHAAGVADDFDRPPTACQPWTRCLVLPEGARLVAVERLDGPLPRVLVSFDRDGPWPEGCAPETVARGVTWLTCDAGRGSLPPHPPPEAQP